MKKGDSLRLHIVENGYLLISNYGFMDGVPQNGTFVFETPEALTKWLLKNLKEASKHE